MDPLPSVLAELGRSEARQPSFVAPHSDSEDEAETTKRCEHEDGCVDRFCKLLHPCPRCAGNERWQPRSAFGVATRDYPQLKVYKGERFLLCAAHREEELSDRAARDRAKQRQFVSPLAPPAVASSSSVTAVNEVNQRCKRGSLCRSGACAFLHPCRLCGADAQWHPMAAFGVRAKDALGGRGKRGSRYATCLQHRARIAPRNANQDDVKTPPLSTTRPEPVAIAADAEPATMPMDAASSSAASSASTKPKDNQFLPTLAANDRCKIGADCRDAKCPALLHPCSQCRNWLPFDVFGVLDRDCGPRKAGDRIGSCSKHRKTDKKSPRKPAISDEQVAAAMSEDPKVNSPAVVALIAQITPINEPCSLDANCEDHKCPRLHPCRTCRTRLYTLAQLGLSIHRNGSVRRMKNCAAHRLRQRKSAQLRMHDTDSDSDRRPVRKRRESYDSGADFSVEFVVDKPAL